MVGGCLHYANSLEGNELKSVQPQVAKFKKKTSCVGKGNKLKTTPTREKNNKNVLFSRKKKQRGNVSFFGVEILGSFG